MSSSYLHGWKHPVWESLSSSVLAKPAGAFTTRGSLCCPHTPRPVRDLVTTSLPSQDRGKMASHVGSTTPPRSRRGAGREEDSGGAARPPAGRAH